MSIRRSGDLKTRTDVRTSEGIVIASYLPNNYWWLFQILPQLVEFNYNKNVGCIPLAVVAVCVGSGGGGKECLPGLSGWGCLAMRSICPGGCRCLPRRGVGGSINIFVIKRAQTCHLLFNRLGYYHSTSKTYVTDGIFKLTPIIVQ